MTNTQINQRTATESDAWTGVETGGILPDFQLGARQWRTWAALSDSQRAEANRLATNGARVSSALKAVTQ